MALPKSMETIFILIDISGYTKFMIENKRSLDHAQLIINELFDELFKHVSDPLNVAEIEGDALFLYAVKQSTSDEWDKTKLQIGKMIEKVPDIFHKKMLSLIAHCPCDCTACFNMSELGVKVIVHQGNAIINKINRFTKVSGIDTIIAHRLLKNTVPAPNYILATESIFDGLQLETCDKFYAHTETYEDIGVVNCKVCINHVPGEATVRYSKKYRARRLMHLLKTEFALIAAALGLKKLKTFTFHNHTRHV